MTSRIRNRAQRLRLGQSGVTQDVSHDIPAGNDGPGLGSTPTRLAVIATTLSTVATIWRKEVDFAWLSVAIWPPILLLEYV